jgi:hypothetical protein
MLFARQRAGEPLPHAAHEVLPGSTRNSYQEAERERGSAAPSDM